jgi:hypothetical protein
VVVVAVVVAADVVGVVATAGQSSELVISELAAAVSELLVSGMRLLPQRTTVAGPSVDWKMNMKMSLLVVVLVM